MSNKVRRRFLVQTLVALTMALLTGCSQQHDTDSAPAGMAAGAPQSPAQAQSANAAAQAARAKHGNPVGQ